jgi:uncharacterized protein YgiM (DUF1202 family)
MNGRIRIIVSTFVIVFACSSFAYAGDLVTTQFRAGSQTGRVALPHLTNKGVVTEFLDLNDTGIGKSVGYLVWREVLTAISDQARAGVIIAHPPGETRVVDMLKDNYHLAAVDIAKHQKSPMVLWGIAEEGSDKILVSTHLSLIPEIQSSDLSLHAELRGMEARGWEAEITRTRFNFALVESRRGKLFNRPIITKTRTPLKAGPNKESRTIAVSEKGKLYQAVDMENEWFKVTFENSESAYLHIWEVDVPPRHVETERRRTNVRLRSGPGTDYAKIGTAKSFEGVFEVLDMRYRAKHGLWYQINFEGKPVWVWGGLVRPRFSFPAVHFMAGLYRFRARSFDKAFQEFERFTNFQEVEESNTSLATAYQLMGTSGLMSGGIHSSVSLEAFSDAIKLTPYDPAAYNLRAVSRMGRGVPNQGRMDGILDDLNQALMLDRRNDRALDLLIRVGMLIERGKGEAVGEFFRINPDTRRKYFQIKNRIETQASALRPTTNIRVLPAQ